MREDKQKTITLKKAKDTIEGEFFRGKSEVAYRIEIKR